MTTAEGSDPIQEFVRDLPNKEKAQLAEELISNVRMEKTFIGPLPPPEDFEKYNQTLPGAADRILGMAEKEQEIRAAGQEKILSNDSKRIKAAAFLGLALICVAAIATWNNQAEIALPLGLIGGISTMLRQLLAWWDSRKKSGQ